MSDRMTAEQPKLAWEVTLDDVTSITFAETRKKAIWHAVASAREAGYYLGRKNSKYPKWPKSIRAVRARRFDFSPMKYNARQRCFAVEFLEATT